MTDALRASTERAGDVARIRRLFRLFGATQARGRSPVYETLSEAVASDDGLLGLLLDTPTDQRRPSLLFACVNLVLASDPGAALAAYYPIHGGRRAVDDRLAPAFSAFCGEHRDALLRLLRERSTQTNEIRRCIALHIGLDHVHRHWPGPLALIEIGASAGLNLLFDHYRYRLNDQETNTASQVVVSCEVRGGPSGAGLLGPAPRIARRLGIDQHPVDVSDSDARAWLEAFIWPEQVEDLTTLRGAMDLARSASSIALEHGDATVDTARMLAELPGDEPIVVFTASLLSYLSTDGRTAFVGQLQEAARHRLVAWVFAEGPGLLATTGLSIAALAGPLSQNNTLYLVGVSLRESDRHDDQLLAIADPYLRWLAPARSGADDFRWVLDDAGHNGG